MRAPLGLRVASVLIGTPTFALADVLTVGPSGADFTQIKAAVQAASDGDAIHVSPGIYEGFRVDDKALRIVNTGTGTVSVTGVIRIHDLSPGKTLVLSGIDAAAAGAEGLIVFQCQGSVRVQGGEFEGGPGFDGTAYRPGFDGARVVESNDVVLVRCILEGGEGVWGCWDCFIPTTGGGAGLRVEDSCVALLSSTAQGGRGGSADEDDEGGDGGDGVSAEDSRLFVAGNVLRGSFGGAGGAASMPSRWAPARAGRPGSTRSRSGGTADGVARIRGATPAVLRSAARPIPQEREAGRLAPALPAGPRPGRGRAEAEERVARLRDGRDVRGPL